MNQNFTSKKDDSKVMTSSVKNWRAFRYSLICLLFITLGSTSEIKVKDSVIATDFINPPSTVKVHTWWHWIDGAITKDGITKDLEAMHQQGISQATILNVGLFDGRDFGVPKVIFNTPQWYEMFRWALHEAQRLGIKIGVHNCDGWSSSGGPWITPEMSMKQYVWTKTVIVGGKKVQAKLEKPLANLNYYKDVAVVAYRTDMPNNSYHTAHPKTILNDSVEVSYLSDGNPVSAISMRRGDFIQINFSEEFAADQILVHVRRPFMWRDMSTFPSKLCLLVSKDGNKYNKVKDIDIIGLNKSTLIPIPNVKSKFFRLQLIDFSTVDPEFGLALAEVELLKTNEKPTFSPTIPNLQEKTVCLKNGERTTIDSLGKNAANEIIQNEAQVIDLTKNLSPDGMLNWDAPTGNWCVFRFGYTTTGSTNQPATKEGVGLECDKMDTAALNFHFKNFPQKIIDQAGEYKGNTFKFFLVDSWECGFQNWSADFATEFEKQHGYNLIKWIPVLCGETIGSSELSEGFLYDFRTTIANLIENNYYKQFSKLCHKQNVEMHCEVIYGDASAPPIDVLKTNTYADLPMWEFWAGPPPAKIYPEPYVPQPRIKGVLPVFASNSYQLPIIAAESYTGWAHYSEYPFYLKPFGDRAFCTGVNQLILHSYVHQPADKFPGMTLGRFGSHFNRQNTWWSMANDWFLYQNRVQYMLQKGEIISDVLYYLGDQFPQFIANNYIKYLPYGYRASACNFDILVNKAKVKDGKIVLSPNQIFSILVLPDNRLLELSSLKKIEELVKEGAIIYGLKPQKTLSLKGKRDDSKIFTEITDKLWGKEENSAIGENNVGKGKVVWGKPVEKVLQETKLVPDLSTDQPDSLNIQFIHKKIGETDVYFVANQQNMELKRELVFRITNKIPEIWNPEYGTTLKVTNYSNENNLVRIPVTLSPYESLFFVFNGQDKPHKLTDITAKKPEVEEISTFTGTLSFSPAYPSKIAPVEITGLKSWTDFTDPAIKYFSGKASYKIHFKLPAGFKPGSDSILLSLGKIGSVAGVKLNNKWLGNIWIPDFKMDVTNILQAENELEIEIANVYRNRIIGDLIESGKMQNVWTTSPAETYFEKDKTLQPSGLMGPIRLFKFKIN